jgi:predicted permease
VLPADAGFEVHGLGAGALALHVMEPLKAPGDVVQRVRLVIEVPADSRHKAAVDPRLCGCHAVATVHDRRAVFLSISRLLQFTPATTGGLILVAGLGNTSFVGLPMIETFYGTNGMPIGILIDQLGTYLVLSTLGIAVAALFSSETPSGAGILKRICTFPPFIALFASLLLLPVDYPDWLIAVLRRLGDTLAPLALVSVGLQLRLDQLSGIRVPLSIGIAFKLLVGPALVMLVYVGLLRAAGDVVQITLFESAMGPMIGASIVAIQHGLNPPLITLLVGLGITASFLSLPLWWYVLQGV